jgi:hypothetical protein
MVGIWQIELEVCTTSGQKLSEERFVEFLSRVVAQKTLDVVPTGVKLGLVMLICSEASLLFPIRKEVCSGPLGVVVNE